MYRKIGSLIVLFALTTATLQAKEGMWLPSDLSSLPLAEEGCELSAEDIFSPDSNSLSRAIIGLGSVSSPFRFFCTASFVSDEGLILTNYHCGTRMIQQHSSMGGNIFEKGFWAENNAEELHNEELTASILLDMYECTDTVLHYIRTSSSEPKISEIIDSLTTVLESRAELGSNERISIKSFYDGNKYYAMTYRIYKDVRLAGVPPRSIGKFGGDTDNWMWPRHTGDFCLLRIYADSCGQSAEYDISNIPVRPDRYLRVAQTPYREGDYSFVMGYPGGTSRYMPADEVRVLTEVSYSERAKIRERMLAVMDERMAADEEVYLKYYVLHQSVANYYKNFKGQVEAARLHGTVARRLQQEDSLVTRMERLTDSLIFYPFQFEILLDSVRSFRFADAYYREALLFGSSVMQAATKIDPIYGQLRKNTGMHSEIAFAAMEQKTAIDELYANFDAATEAALMSAGLRISMEMLKGDFRPKYFRQIEKKFKNDTDNFCERAFQNSIFGSKETISAFLAHPDLKVLEKDPIFSLYRSVSDVQKSQRAQVATYNSQIRLSKKQYTAQKIYVDSAMGKQYYPDANSTLRLTYGHVSGYSTGDAQQYKYQTTAKGILEKYKPGSNDFDADTAFVRILQQHPEQPVCLLSENDITGGNSGSPLMDARGDIIGLAFDGNWEALSGDIEYLPALQRCISVDMQYVIFVIEQIGRSKRILQELRP